jgi:hypothetical protein
MFLELEDLLVLPRGAASCMTIVCTTAESRTTAKLLFPICKHGFAPEAVHFIGETVQ